MEDLNENKLVLKKRVIISGLPKSLNQGLRELYDKHGLAYDELVEDTEDEIVEKEDYDYKET